MCTDFKLIKNYLNHLNSTILCKPDELTETGFLFPFRRCTCCLAPQSIPEWPKFNIHRRRNCKENIFVREFCFFCCRHSLQFYVFVKHSLIYLLSGSCIAPLQFCCVLEKCWVINVDLVNMLQNLVFIIKKIKAML